MREIQKMSKESAILNNFVNERNGCLVPKDVKELLEVQDRLGVLLSKTVSTDDAITTARSHRADSFDRLQRSVTECKKMIEAVAAREGRTLVVPPVGAALFRPARIEALAAKYLRAAKTAGDDAAVKTAAVQLEKALEEYATASGDTTENIYTTRTFKRELETELNDIRAKLNGFASYIAGNVSRAERAELYSRLVRARAATTRTRRTAADVDPTATAQPTTFTATTPALPAIPATVVPPSSEHPTMSANA